jgi:hypothetical protein
MADCECSLELILCPWRDLNSSLLRGHGGWFLEKVVEWNLVEVSEWGETLDGLLKGFCFLE